MQTLPAGSTLWTHGGKYLNTSLLASLNADGRQAWMSTLPSTLRTLLDRSRTEPRPCQEAPEGDWHSWLFLGGRGAGKTWAGATWLTGLAARGTRLALVGASLHDVREVMIEGESGLKAVADPNNRPRYESSRRRLIWPGGGVAYAFSAEDPESLRGPQFHYGWADEFCAWRQPAESLAMLRLGLRLGDRPRLCVTTTPKPVRALRLLMAETGMAVTRAATEDNAFLPKDFVAGLIALYGGTRLAAQELEGLIVDDGDRPLWRAEALERVYSPRPERFDDVVVAVDPSVTAAGDACGIVVAGRVGERGYVLEDATVSGLSSLGWAQRVVAAVKAHGAARIVAEANQGGEMVRTVLNLAGCDVPVELVHARLSKRARAEPVAALYEQGRVRHCPEVPGARFSALDEELTGLGGEARGRSPGNRSPDRADALVWALTALLIVGRAGPRLRWL